ASVVASGESILTRAVATAAQPGNPIGAAAIAAAKAAETPGASGAEKKAAVIAAIVPVIAQEAMKGGITELEADAETFAGMVVEEVVSIMKSTPLGILAAAVLHVFGVKLPATAA
ncbi:MAG: hypothetical protein ACRYGP_10080, partial [Janthinobacterium lividum]